MENSILPCLEIGAARDEAELSVILMHGLGADGHDFADVADALAAAAEPRKWRFVLPHAPTIAVTINMGTEMPAWYDILDMAQRRKVDWKTVATSQENIEVLLARETGRVALAGFSQGAAMALHVGLRHQAEVAGVLMMSGYLLESDDQPCPEKFGDLPIGIFHGSDDPVVPFEAAEETLACLEAAGHAPSLKRYEGLDHSVAEQELRDVFAWLSALD